MTDYPAVLTALYPGAEWSLSGDTYDGLTWLDDSPKPTKKKLDDAWPQVQHDLEVARIRAERANRYNAETDPIYLKVQRGEDGHTLESWKAAVDAIRADLPYPPEVTK
jgi:hypothetical protein